MLVQRGIGHRSAVLRVTTHDPNLRHYRIEGQRLLRQTIASLDEIDLVLRSKLDGLPVEKRQLALARVTTFIALLNSRNSVALEEVDALRKLATPSFQPRLEKLVGELILVKTEPPTDRIDQLRTVALRTHQSPLWVQYCIRLLGRAEALKLLTSEPRLRYVRINSLRVPRKAERTKLARSTGRNVTQVPTLSDVFSLPEGESVSSLSSFFLKGMFQVQDLASFLAVKAAKPEAGELVLDLCAAPGAKTATLAQLMKNKGRIVSADYSTVRMRTWTSETSRLGVRIAEPIIADVTHLGLRGVFDLALLDPPCSGTGILDRNPDMKWHVTVESIERYSTLQLRMLEEAAKAINQTGRVLYCTCSLTLEENEIVVSSFLRKHPDFETRPILEEFGAPGLRGMSDCRRFYPHRDRTAGYFVARLQRSN